MDLAAYIQLLLKRNKIEKQLKQLKQLHDFALKYERLGQGKVKVEDLKLFSSKQVDAVRRDTAEISKLLNKFKARTPQMPASQSHKYYQAMMNAAKKHGTDSKQFAQAQKDYKAELTRLGKALNKMHAALTRETGRLQVIAGKYRKAATYCSRMAPVIQGFSSWTNILGLGATFFKAGQNMTALAGMLVDVA